MIDSHNKNVKLNNILQRLSHYVSAIGTFTLLMYVSEIRPRVWSVWF